MAPQPLLGLSGAELHRLVVDCAAAVGLEHMHLVPYRRRHSGPSSDIASKVRDLADVQQAGERLSGDGGPGAGVVALRQHRSVPGDPHRGCAQGAGGEQLVHVGQRELLAVARSDRDLQSFANFCKTKHLLLQNIIKFTKFTKSL